MPEPGLLTSLLLVLPIVTIGATVQASIGMGLNLFAIPLLMLIDPVYAPGPILVACLLLSALAFWRMPVVIEQRDMTCSLAGLAAGTVAAAALLTAIDTAGLGRLLGALVVLGVGLILSGRSVRITPTSLVTAGAAAGIMGTIAGVHGPPVAMLYGGQAPTRVRGALLAFIGIGSALSVAALAAVGRFGAREVTATLILLPGVGLGLLLAPRLATLIDARRIRLATLLVSGMSGLALVLRG